MSPETGLAMLCGGTILATGGLGGWTVARATGKPRCSCGHGYGCVDRFTGHCTATVVETNWVYGMRRIHKRVPCPCKEHRQNVIRAITETAP